MILCSGLALALHLATAVADGPAEPQQQAVPSPERPGVEEIPEDLVLPKRLNEVEVTYPPGLLDREEPPGGTLIVDFVVDVHGATRNLELRGSLDPAIDEAVREAVAGLRYEPATYRGRAVEVAMSIEVHIEPPQVEQAQDWPAVEEEAVEKEDDDRDLPVRIRGMVLAGNTLFAAGPPDVVPADDPMAAFEGRRGGVLLAVSPADGKTLSERKLDSPPEFDGLIAAAGRLYVSLTNGEVLCLGESL